MTKKGGRKREPVRRSKRSAPSEPRPTQRRLWTKSRTKVLTTRKGEKVTAKQTVLKLKRSVSIKKGTDLGTFFDKNVAPEFKKFVGRKLKSKQGSRFILRSEHTHSGKGFRRKNYFSGSRQRIKSLGKGFDRVVKRLRAKFIASFKKYLARKGMTSISLSGFHMEVIKHSVKKPGVSRAVSTKNTRSGRRKKK